MVGLIARSDRTGLGYQTYALARMLKPDKILLVNSTSFNQNEQNPEWYEGFYVEKTQGWPTNLEVSRFMRGLKYLFTAETVYNHKVCEIGKAKGCKVFIQYNWEFCEHIKERHLPKPYMWLAPSSWNVDEMKKRFPNTRILRPPIVMSDFKRSRNKNLERSRGRRFLHIMGNPAAHDRNGTYDLLDSLQYSTEEFELVIRSQKPIEEYMKYNDPRIRWEIRDIRNQEEMYEDFDLMILPRRYGGLCLPMNEALSSALPVIMSNISPNADLLKPEWLVGATKTHTFNARVPVDVHRTNIIQLGKKIDEFARMSDSDLQNHKVEALDISMDNLSHEKLISSYKEIMV